MTQRTISGPFANKTLFEQAGIPLPGPKATWEGWAQAAKAVAAIMAFGSGVLISALSFELMDEAWKQGGFPAVGAGFITGAAVYTALNMMLAARGARHRKRSDTPKREEHAAVAPKGNSASLALGALIDGVPESIVIGTSLLAGGAIGWVAVAAVFLSNLPEGLSSAAGARREGKTVMSEEDGVTRNSAAAVERTLAGAIAWVILAMIIDTMAPEAFEGTHDFAGLIAVFGFLTAFGLSKLA